MCLGKTREYAGKAPHLIRKYVRYWIGGIGVTETDVVRTTIVWRLSVRTKKLLFDPVVLTSFSLKITLDRAGQHGRTELHAATPLFKAGKVAITSVPSRHERAVPFVALLPARVAPPTVINRTDGGAVGRARRDTDGTGAGDTGPIASGNAGEVRGATGDEGPKAAAHAAARQRQKDAVVARPLGSAGVVAPKRAGVVL